MSIHWVILETLCDSHCLFLRNLFSFLCLWTGQYRVCTSLTVRSNTNKNSTAQLATPPFQANLSEHSWFKFPIYHAIFLKLRSVDSSSCSFMAPARKKLRIRFEECTPKTPASPNFYQCHLAMPLWYRRRNRKREDQFMYTLYTVSFAGVYTSLLCVRALQ